MENTVAFTELMNLLSVVASFVTTPIFFGLSILHLLVITLIFNQVIGILLGGIAPRINFGRDNHTASDNHTVSSSSSSLTVDPEMYKHYLEAGGKRF